MNIQENNNFNFYQFIYFRVFDLTDKKFIPFVFRQVFLLVNLFFLNTSFATSNEHTGIDKLVAQADVIVIGEYIDVSSDWDKKKIYTSATFKTGRIIKGEASDTIIIKVLGGTAMHPRLNTPITMNISNGVSFTKGKKALVFLKKNNNTFQIVGMSKGNISIISDDSGQEYMGGGIKKIAAHTENEATVIRSKKMRVDEFTAYIENLVEQHK